MNIKTSRTLITTLIGGFAAFSAQAANTVETLWFTDSQVSAYYTIDEADHRIVLINEAGPQGKGAIGRDEKQLGDGERFVCTQVGHGNNALATTLVVTRRGEKLDVQIHTAPRASTVVLAND